MFETVAAILEIATKAPTGIDYFYMPPASQWVPDDVLKEDYAGEHFALSVVGLRNVSSKVLGSIRIKLPYTTTHHPKLETHGTEEAICATYHENTHEVSVLRLDPGESIYVVIFLSGEEADTFTEPVVIITDKLLSRGMRAIGYLKRRPKEVLLMIGVLCLPLVVVALMTYFLASETNLNPRVRAVQQAMKGYVGCIPTAYKQSEVNDSLLSRSRLGQAAILQMNHVSNINQLHDKKYVVICVAR